MRTVRARAATLLLTGLLVACGSDEPLTHAEFVERAGGICSDALGQMRELGADLPEPTDASAARWAEVLGETNPILEGMVEDLRDLEPPSQDAQGFVTLLAAYEEVIDHQEEVRVAAETGNSSAMSQPSEETTFAWIDADQAASELGLEGCTLLRED